MGPFGTRRCGGGPEGPSTFEAYRLDQCGQCFVPAQHPVATRRDAGSGARCGQNFSSPSRIPPVVRAPSSATQSRPQSQLARTIGCPLFGYPTAKASPNPTPRPCKKPLTFGVCTCTPFSSMYTSG